MRSAAEILEGLPELEVPPKQMPSAIPVCTTEPVERPGDDYNNRGDIRPLLQTHGWTFSHESPDGNEHWTRPGKDHATSATLKEGVFYVFTSNGDPFEQNKGYSQFQVYSLLEHNGDFTAAANSLRDQGFGEDLGTLGVDLSNFHVKSAPLKLEFDQGPRTLADLLDDPIVLSPRPRIPSTYPTLDDALQGGFVVGGMYCIVGLTGRGKSTMASNLARHFAENGDRVLWITLEDDDTSSARKLLSHKTRIPMRKLENFSTLQENHPEDARRVEEAIPELKSLPLKVEASTCGLEQLERLIQSETERGTQAVLLDQSSWVSVTGAESTYQEASEISRRLKQLAKRLKIVLIVLIQINRGGALANREGQDIELFHIRDSGRWEQDADGVLIIQSLDESAAPATMRVDVKKHRHGRRELAMYFLYTLDCGLIENHPDRKLPESLVEAQTSTLTTPVEWTVERFVTELISPNDQSWGAIMEHAQSLGLKEYVAKRLLNHAMDLGKVFCRKNSNGRKCYSTTPLPETEAVKPEIDSKAHIVQLLIQFPELSARKIADMCGDSYSTVYRVRKKHFSKSVSSETNRVSEP